MAFDNCIIFFMTDNIVSKTRSKDASLVQPVALTSQIHLKGQECESQVWREMGREVDTDRGRPGVQGPCLRHRQLHRKAAVTLTSSDV